MKRNKRGFSYYLSKETIREYQKKPLSLRLAWLYHGNLLRMGYPKKVIRLQDKFR